MRTVWVLWVRETGPVYHDTEHAAMSALAARPKSTYPVGRPPATDAVVYPITIEPAVKPPGYWDRHQHQEAAA